MSLIDFLEDTATRAIPMRKALLAALAMAMIVVGGARALGGAYLMSASQARAALARGKLSTQSFDAAAERLSASTRWWAYDARAWDALGALRLEAAYAKDGAVDPAESGAALAAFQQAAARAPGQPLFWMRRAAAERAGGSRDAAIGSLGMSIDAGARHPQAMRFRFQLGLELWPDLPADMQQKIAVQGVSAARQGDAELRFVARLLRDAPPDLRRAVFVLMTPEERIRFLTALRVR